MDVLSTLRFDMVKSVTSLKYILWDVVPPITPQSLTVVYVMSILEPLPPEMPAPLFCNRQVFDTVTPVIVVLFPRGDPPDPI